jgi:serine/threonine protein kinase/outer membrane protein assembly factor BamB
MPALFSRGEKLENGHYTVVKEIGVGGMGVVYHCRDELLTRDVAIKMLLPELMSDKKNLEVFRQEARLAAQLEHPNLVTVYDIGVEERQGKHHHFLAMEYLTGGNLAIRLQDSPLSLEHALNWMKQLASGISFAHKRGVVHQDIKADNIFITNEGDLKIGDFGLARLLVGRVGAANTKIMGTPAYMSPELARGEPQDHRSDIYSLGVLFFEMATGSLPFRAKGMIEMAMKHATAAIPSIRRQNPEAPEVLDKVIRRMMAKMAEDRYQNAADILNIIDELIFELRVQRLGISSNRPLLTSGEVLQDALDERDARSTGQRRAVQAPDVLPERPGKQIPKIDASSPNANLGSTLELERETDRVREQEREDKERAAKWQGSEAKQTTRKTVDKKEEGKKTERKADAKPSEEGMPTSAVPLSKETEPPALPGPSAASKQPAVARTSGVHANQSLQKLRVALETQWMFKTKGPIGWSAQPLIDRSEKILFIPSCDGNLYAVDVRAGNKLWNCQLTEPIVSAPVTIGNYVFVSSASGETLCLDSYTGKVIWNKSINAKTVASLATIKESALLVASGNDLRALDVRSGEVLWFYSTGAPVVASPLVQGDLVLIGTKGGELHAVNSAKGNLIWKFVADGAIISSPFASVDTAYVGTKSGNFYAVEMRQGAMIWQYPANGSIVSSGAIVFTSVAFASQDRWLYCCEKYDGRLKWKSAVKGKVSADLCTYKGQIICASEDGWLQTFSAANGQMKWQTDISKRIQSPPMVSNNSLYVGTVEGELYAYSLAAADNLEQTA